MAWLGNPPTSCKRIPRHAVVRAKRCVHLDAVLKRKKIADLYRNG